MKTNDSADFFSFLFLYISFDFFFSFCSKGWDNPSLSISASFAENRKERMQKSNNVHPPALQPHNHAG